jgi:hypothetical protein
VTAEDEVDEDSGKEGRIVAFFLGLALGFAFTVIIGVVIGHCIASSLGVRKETKQGVAEAGHPFQEDALQPASPEKEYSPELEQEDVEEEEVFSSPNRTLDSPKQTIEEEKRSMEEEVEQLMGSPREAVNAEMLVSGGSSAKDSPPDDSIVAKALFQRHEDSPDEDIEFQLIRRMEQECPSDVDSDNISRDEEVPEYEPNISNTPTEKAYPVEGEKEGQAEDVEDPASPETPSVDIKFETLVSGEYGEQTERTVGMPAEGIVFQTLALGGFDNGHVDVTMTSASTSSSPDDNQEQERNGSSSSSSPGDLASQLCFQGQAGHIGFPSP